VLRRTKGRLISLTARGVQKEISVREVLSPAPQNRVIHDLDDLFQNLRGARARLRRGIVPSEEIKKRVGESRRAGPTRCRRIACGSQFCGLQVIFR
jgi:hypothetical protein